MRTHNRSIKAMLAMCAVMVFTSAHAELAVDPFSRWSQAQSQPGAEYLYAGGVGNATLALLRRDSPHLRSTDGGVTWSPFTLPAPAYELFIAPTTGAVWYAHFGDGLYRSTDGGSTWSRRSAIPAQPYAAGSYSISADPDVLYRSVTEFVPCGEVCSIPPPVGQTLQASEDGGVTWRNLGSREVAAYAFASPLQPGLVFAAIGQELRKSTDGGRTWTKLPLPSINGYFVIVAPDRNDAGFLNVATRGTQYPETVYSS